MILNEVKEEFVRDLLAKGERIDGRGFDEYRPIAVEKGVIPNAEGSALAHVGGTKVLAGVKIDVLEPFADRPGEGVLMFNSEFSPIAHPEFYAGPPNEHSIELARVVDRGIRSAESVDVKALGLPSGKVLGVFVDLYILDQSGNLIDTAALAAMAALKNARLPKIEAAAREGQKETLVRTESSGNIAITRDVVSTSVEKIDGKFLVDASDEEETASQGRLTLATCSDDLLCCGQKSGKAGFTKEEIEQAMELAFAKRKELIKYV